MSQHEQSKEFSNAFSLFFHFYKFWGDYLYRSYRNKRISIPTVDFTTMYYMLKTHLQTLESTKSSNLFNSYAR